jgi:hypothetical protein
MVPSVDVPEPVHFWREGELQIFKRIVTPTRFRIDRTRHFLKGGRAAKNFFGSRLLPKPTFARLIW